MNPPFDKEERLRLRHCGVLNAHFPIKVGNMTWQEITGYCANCGEPIPPALFRGEALPTFTNLCHVKAVGFCADCELVTCYSWHLKPDGVTGYNARGQWTTWFTPRPSANCFPSSYLLTPNKTHASQ